MPTALGTYREMGWSALMTLLSAQARIQGKYPAVAQSVRPVAMAPQKMEQAKGPGRYRAQFQTALRLPQASR